MNFGLWIATLATANLLLYALWHRLAYSASDAENARIAAIHDQQDRIEQQARVEAAQRLWDQADAEIEAMAADFQWAVIEQEWHAFVESWPTCDEAGR